MCRMLGAVVLRLLHVFLNAHVRSLDPISDFVSYILLLQSLASVDVVCRLSGHNLACLEF
jgi:hypothetical protein